ncbi:hypothetical protein OUZ56_033041 [Daphnia magna]|uniref:Uncharacterized protein n=1 Tax=Daphnia magna TaxID=35525 RepID=A0ABR0BA35_9CRUS|nr:hypothetical protein OUZ56_033041 [Daphnia magna]
MSRNRTPPSEFYGSRFYNPRASFYDQPMADHERIRDREMRIRSHPQHPSYRGRERSPVSFTRYEPRYNDRKREVFGRERFGFVSDVEPHWTIGHAKTSGKTAGAKVQMATDVVRMAFTFLVETVCAMMTKDSATVLGKTVFSMTRKQVIAFDAGGFSCDSEGRRLPGASMGLSDDENLRNAPPSSSNIRPTRAERVFVDPVSQTSIAESLETDQIEESRP